MSAPPLPQVYRQLWQRGYRPVVLRPRALANAVRGIFGLAPYRELGLWTKVG